MINESNGTFENFLFSNCSVVTDVTKNVPRGGSIYMIQSSYKFNNSNFTSNFVRSEGSDSYVSGGAIDVLYSDVIIEKCFFLSIIQFDQKIILLMEFRYISFFQM